MTNASIQFSNDDDDDEYSDDDDKNIDDGKVFDNGV